MDRFFRSPKAEWTLRVDYASFEEAKYLDHCISRTTDVVGTALAVRVRYLQQPTLHG